MYSRKEFVSAVLEYCGRRGYDVTLSSPWRLEMNKSTMAAEMSEETAADETMFLCSSCGFECRYEYFGRKPPFSKSVVYVFCCFV